MKVRHILLTTDLSPESLHPCEPVAAFAAEIGARITLLHIVEELRISPHGAPLAPPIKPVDVEQRTEHAMAALEEQRKSLGAGVEVEIVTIGGENIAHSVETYAKAHDVDLICLSTHGRTGFRHLVLGSVAESIIRHSTVPVLSFPQPR